MRFRRHRQAQIIGWQAAFLVGGDGASHGALAPVIRGEREIPIVEFRMKLLQIIERPAGGDRVDQSVSARLLGGQDAAYPHVGGHGIDRAMACLSDALLQQP